MREYRPGGFNILPPVIKNLLIINVLMFLATVVLENFGIDLNYILGLYYPTSPLFYPWQFITYMFMHGSWSHLFFNMFALWMFGNVIENILGAKRFLIFYFVCGIGAALLHLGVSTIENYDSIQWFAGLDSETKATMMDYFKYSGKGDPRIAPLVIPTVGASGSVFGLLFAFGYLFPNMPIYLYFLFPIKAKWFVAGYAAIELYSGLSGAHTGVAHFAHLGGILFAFLLLRAWKLNHRNVFY